MAANVTALTVVDDKRIIHHANRRRCASRGFQEIPNRPGIAALAADERLQQRRVGERLRLRQGQVLSVHGGRNSTATFFLAAHPAAFDKFVQPINQVNQHSESAQENKNDDRSAVDKPLSREQRGNRADK